MENLDDGPYCQHLCDPLDCDELCVCGHECWEHLLWGNRPCDECSCEEFVDEEIISDEID